MKITRYLCDKCGRELLDGEQCVRLNLDFCESCEEELLLIVQQWLDEDQKPKSAFEINQEKRKAEKEAKEKADELVFDSCEKVLADINGEPKRRGHIDWDKAIEMKMEGFKHEEIAKAVGTTLGTIDNAIYAQMRKRGIKYGKN